MKRADLHESEAKLSANVAGVEANGEPVAITRHGRIVAEIHPHRQEGLVPKRGCLKSADFFIAGDFDTPEAGFEDFFRDLDKS